MKVWILFSELDLGPSGVVRTPLSMYENQADAEKSRQDRMDQLGSLASCVLARRTPGGLFPEDMPSVAMLATCGINKVSFVTVAGETVSPIVKAGPRLVVP